MLGPAPAEALAVKALAARRLPAWTQAVQALQAEAQAWKKAWKEAASRSKILAHLWVAVVAVDPCLASCLLEPVAGRRLW